MNAEQNPERGTEPRTWNPGTLNRSDKIGPLLYQAARDLRLGMRLARKAPGFAASAALVVALGIGTTTAIFSVVYGVMLRPLPYDEPDRLVALWSRVPGASQRVRLNAADHRVLAFHPVLRTISLGSLDRWTVGS